MTSWRIGWIKISNRVVYCGHAGNGPWSEILKGKITNWRFRLVGYGSSEDSVSKEKWSCIRCCNKRCHSSPLNWTIFKSWDTLLVSSITSCSHIFWLATSFWSPSESTGKSLSAETEEAREACWYNTNDLHQVTSSYVGSSIGKTLIFGSSSHKPLSWFRCKC